MKKIILIILLLINFVLAYTQVNLGFKFGANASVYRMYDFDLEKYKTGFNGGFFIRHPINKKLFLQTEILYNEKGYRYNGNFPVTTYIDYISIPALCGFVATNKLSFLAGPELDFLISENQKLETSGSYSDVHKKFDISAVAGVAYKLTNTFGIEARYCYGLISTYKTYGAGPNGDPLEQYVGNNKVYQLNVFYIIPK